MRRLVFTVGVLASLCASLPARAEPPGFYEAQRAFEGSLEPPLRQLLQVWLIAGGFSNSVPNERFSTRTFHALQSFEAQNGFVANGMLDKPQVQRLAAIVDPMFAQWGFQRIALPGHSAAIWVPFGLNLEVRTTDKGYRYKDRQGRFDLALLALPNVTLRATYDTLVEKEVALGTTIHFKAIKDDWFVLSTTKVDGTDHYYRYHQEGAFLTGFAMDWNNAAGNINAERIAVLDSAILAASIYGEPFINPPQPPKAEAKAEPDPSAAAQPVTVPVPPAQPRPKDTYSTGTGFFVAEDGSLVTNAHVIADCTNMSVKTDDGSMSTALRIATDTANDLALLRLTKLPTKPPRVATLRVGSRLGEGVEAFGFPHSDVLSTSGNFTLGNVTALTGLHDDIRYFQMSAPVQASNSGGPLLDTSGNVVGVVSAKLDAIKMMVASDDLPQNVNFAIKSAMVAAFLDANRVTYKVGTPAATPLQSADIADQARAMSGFVVCR